VLRFGLRDHLADASVSASGWWGPATPPSWLAHQPVFDGGREARSPISRSAPSHSLDRGCPPSKRGTGRVRGGLRLATAARNRLWRKGAPLHGLPQRGTVPRRVTARTFAPLRVPRLGRSPRRGCPLLPSALGGAPRSPQTRLQPGPSGAVARSPVSSSRNCRNCFAKSKSSFDRIGTIAPL
jgi:hypothetical protein